MQRLLLKCILRALRLKTTTVHVVLLLLIVHFELGIFFFLIELTFTILTILVRCCFVELRRERLFLLKNVFIEWLLIILVTIRLVVFLTGLLTVVSLILPNLLGVVVILAV